MTTHDKQADAIAAALDDVEPGEKVVVHVYGEPADAHLAKTPGVVFHSNFSTYSGFLFCEECGATDGPEA